MRSRGGRFSTFNRAYGAPSGLNAISGTPARQPMPSSSYTSPYSPSPYHLNHQQPQQQYYHAVPTPSYLASSPSFEQTESFRSTGYGGIGTSAGDRGYFERIGSFTGTQSRYTPALGTHTPGFMDRSPSSDWTRNPSSDWTRSPSSDWINALGTAAEPSWIRKGKFTRMDDRLGQQRHAVDHDRFIIADVGLVSEENSFSRVVSAYERAPTNASPLFSRQASHMMGIAEDEKQPAGLLPMSSQMRAFFEMRSFRSDDSAASSRSISRLPSMTGISEEEKKLFGPISYGPRIGGISPLRALIKSSPHDSKVSSLDVESSHESSMNSSFDWSHDVAFPDRIVDKPSLLSSKEASPKMRPLSPRRDRRSPTLKGLTSSIHSPFFLAETPEEPSSANTHNAFPPPAPGTYYVYGDSYQADAPAEAPSSPKRQANEDKAENNIYTVQVQYLGKEGATHQEHTYDMKEGKSSLAVSDYSAPAHHRAHDTALTRSYSTAGTACGSIYSSGAMYTSGTYSRAGGAYTPRGWDMTLSDDTHTSALIRGRDFTRKSADPYIDVASDYIPVAPATQHPTRDFRWRGADCVSDMHAADMNRHSSHSWEGIRGMYSSGTLAPSYHHASHVRSVSADAHHLRYTSPAPQARGGSVPPQDLNHNNQPQPRGGSLPPQDPNRSLRISNDGSLWISAVNTPEGIRLQQNGTDAHAFPLSRFCTALRREPHDGHSLTSSGHNDRIAHHHHDSYPAGGVYSGNVYTSHVTREQMRGSFDTRSSYGSYDTRRSYDSDGGAPVGMRNSFDEYGRPVAAPVGMRNSFDWPVAASLVPAHGMPPPASSWNQRQDNGAATMPLPAAHMLMSPSELDLDDEVKALRDAVQSRYGGPSQMKQVLAPGSAFVSIQPQPQYSPREACVQSPLSSRKPTSLQEDLGLCIQPFSEGKGWFVSEVRQGGLAFLDGGVRRGDRVISVDDVKVDALSRGEMDRLLAGSGREETTIVAMRPMQLLSDTSLEVFARLPVMPVTSKISRVVNEAYEI